MPISVQRGVTAGAAVLSAGMLSGCFVGGVSPSPPSGSWGQDGYELTPTCTLTAARAGTPVVHGWRLTAGRHIMIAGGRLEKDIRLADGPVRAHVVWTSEEIGARADVLRLLAPQIAGRFSLEPSPAGDELTGVRTQRDLPEGTHAAYAAVRAVSVEFTGSCSSGATLTGDLTGWTDTEIDIVGCPGVPGASATEAAGLARQRFCRA